MNLAETKAVHRDTVPVEQGKVQPAVLALQNVSITYEAGAPIVKDVSLSLHEGETLLFLGPSGCGKSTLAMLCAGLIPRTVEATVAGQVWRHPRLTQSGRIGYVFQDADAQFCMLQVADEIAFGLENLRVPPVEMPSRIHTGLRMAGLETALEAVHSEFSGGMKQKLAIACALAMDADLLVFDEPTANLDPLSTRQVFDQIGSLHHQHKTMIVIEHKFDALLSDVDKVVLFDHDGRIHRVGTVAEVLQEEWDWLVSTGIVPPWKSIPGLLQGAGEVPRRGTSLDGTETHSALEVRGGRCAYKTKSKAGEHTVWSDLSMRVPYGAFTAIVGPNGAGKSSLLQVFAGMQKLAAGEIHLLGRNISGYKRNEIAQKVSYCFQNPEFQFIYERVADELANRVVADHVPPEITHLLAEFGLAGLEQQSPFAMSQGQKRRLSVAAMVREEHELYLLDEPTFGQDAATQKAIMDRLLDLHRVGKTVVMTTHDMDLVAHYANQVIVIADGKVLFTGQPVDLFKEPAVLRQAHLLDDVAQLAQTSSIVQTPSIAQAQTDGEQQVAAGKTEPHKTAPQAPPIIEVNALESRKTPAQKLNPPWLLVTSILSMLVAIFAQNLAQALAMLALPTALLVFLRHLTPWQVLKRLSPFLVFYVLYVWSLTAYGAIPPGTPAIHFLWMHLSWVGFHTGLVLAFRMLGAVAFGVLFVSSAEITDLVVGLSQNFRVPPKFSYGALAGIRFAPLFQSEWAKLKQARQLRGKDARYPVLRPVLYTLPLLSQAIRMSERVAAAMEARGFFGDAAARSNARTYYRDVAVHAYDFVFLVILVGLTVALLVLFR